MLVSSIVSIVSSSILSAASSALSQAAPSYFSQTRLLMALDVDAHFVGAYIKFGRHADTGTCDEEQMLFLLCMVL
jgi:exo-beta-1,3-glucanase (GH17 family)